LTKLVYALRRPRDLPLVEFDAKILGDLAPRLLDAGPAGLKVSLTEPGVPRPFHMPSRSGGLALISIWSSDSETPTSLTPLVAASGLPFGGYRVTESTPRAYDRDWPDGAPSPGATMLTLFRQRSGLTREQFLRRWHEDHSPMALRIHPLWNYVRNVVEERLTPTTPPFDGIVEEQYRDDRDLTDMRRFYGGTLRLLPNLLHVVLQTNTFLQLLTLENHFLRERWLRTPA
jgi:hypothetical protein